MLDDLRNTLGDDEEEEQIADLPINFDEIVAQQEIVKKPPRKILGMTAGERAFLAIIVFFIVLVFSFAILAVTGRIAL